MLDPTLLVRFLVPMFLMKLWLQSQCWIACFWLGLWCSCCWWSSCYSPSASTKAFGQVFSADVFDEVLVTVPVLDFMHLVMSLVLMLLMKFLLQSLVEAPAPVLEPISSDIKVVFTCHICDQQFEKKLLYQRHIRSHSEHNPTIVSCSGHCKQS